MLNQFLIQLSLINGGMAPLFTGRMEEEDLHAVVEKVLAACLENGVAGTAQYLPQALKYNFLKNIAKQWKLLKKAIMKQLKQLGN